MSDPVQRCAEFLKAFAALCVEHHVMLQIDEQDPCNSWEFVEKIAGDCGFTFHISMDDVAEHVRQQFIQAHGIQASL